MQDIRQGKLGKVGKAHLSHVYIPTSAAAEHIWPGLFTNVDLAGGLTALKDLDVRPHLSVLKCDRGFDSEDLVSIEYFLQYPM